MAKIDNVKRIIVEDFQDDHRDTVGKIADNYNYFAEQVTNTINGRLDEENFSSQIINIQVTTDANGFPVGDDRFAGITNLAGTQVINATNLTNVNIFPTGTPFITYEVIGSGLYKIRHISNLPVGSRFQIKVRLIPSS